MLSNNVRGDIRPNCRTSCSEPHLAPLFSINDGYTGPLGSSSAGARTPMASQATMINYARMSHRYTIVALLSMRPQPDTIVFPDHLVERRFLDSENYIDLDRMLTEKAGQFRLNSYDMRDGAGDGPIIPTRMYKYDFSDPVVIEKVKSRRPKNSLTPYQVAALTSVITHHRSAIFPMPLSSPQQIQSSHVWVDDYSHRQRQFQRDKHRYHLLSQSSVPDQRQSPTHYDACTKQMKSLLSNYRSNSERKPHAAPILQRLVEAQRRQQNEKHKINIQNQPSSPCVDSFISTSEHHQKDLTAFCTPASPEQSNPFLTFAWPFATDQDRKFATHPLHIPTAIQTTVKKNQDVFAQLINEQLRCSTTMQTPTTPSVDSGEVNKTIRTDNEDDDEQHFYSAQPSPTRQQNSSRSSFNNSNNAEYTQIYNQAVLLNSLLRNMVKESVIQNSSSNESCSSNNTQSTNSNQKENDSYTEMYNLIRLFSPGIKSVAQQELVQYLKQGCLNERDKMLHLTRSLSANEQNSLKPILLGLINEQLDIMKKQQHIQQGNLTSSQSRHSRETRSALENWFGSDIYTNTYPRMPSDRVVSAYDLEQLH